jgi:hypothetical protein
MSLHQEQETPMTLTIYQASVPVFERSLKALSACIDKATAHAEARKIDPSTLIADRLYPDMFPFSRQVQLASDHARGAPARLAGIDFPKFDPTESSFADLKGRIAKSLDFVASIDKTALDGAEDRELTLPVGGKERIFTGYSYLFTHALPNFFFHVTTAYDILRHNGVELGKRDFLNN